MKYTSTLALAAVLALLAVPGLAQSDYPQNYPGSYPGDSTSGTTYPGGYPGGYPGSTPPASGPTQPTYPGSGYPGSDYPGSTSSGNPYPGDGPYDTTKQPALPPGYTWGMPIVSCDVHGSSGNVGYHEVSGTNEWIHGESGNYVPGKGSLQAFARGTWTAYYPLHDGQGNPVINMNGINNSAWKIDYLQTLDLSGNNLRGTMRGIMDSSSFDEYTPPRHVVDGGSVNAYWVFNANHEAILSIQEPFSLDLNSSYQYNPWNFSFACRFTAGSPYETY